MFVCEPHARHTQILLQGHHLVNHLLFEVDVFFFEIVESSWIFRVIAFIAVLASQITFLLHEANPSERRHSPLRILLLLRLFRLVLDLDLLRQLIDVLVHSFLPAILDLYLRSLLLSSIDTHVRVFHSEISRDRWQSQHLLLALSTFFFKLVSIVHRLGYFVLEGRLQFPPHHDVLLD